MKHAIASAAFFIALAPVPATVIGAAPNPSQEARIKALEDKEQIHDLIDEYNLLHNLEDWDALAKLFAQNGELRAFNTVARGPAQVLTLVREKMGQTPYDPLHVKGVLFNTSVLIIPTDANHAKVESRWIYVVPSADNKPIPSRTGRYREEVVREDGHWKLLVLDDPIDIPTGESNPANMPAGK